MSLLPNLEEAVVTTARRYDRGQRAPRRRRVAFMAAGAGALAIAGTAAVLVIGAAGGGQRGPLRPLDVVDEARAALAPQGGILHIVLSITGKAYDSHGRPIRMSGQAAIVQHVEQWSAKDPLRFRVLYPESKERVPGTTRPVQRRSEYAWADRTETWYPAGAHLMRSITKFSPHSSAARLPAIPGVNRSLDDIAVMLARHQLVDRGTVTVGGRVVRRLSGRISKMVMRGGGTVDYDVDPTTFAPVQITTRMIYLIPAFGGRPASRESSVQTAVVDRFEHLPLTPTSAQLLVIHPPAGTRHKVQTLGEARAAERRARAAEKKRAAEMKRTGNYRGPRITNP